MVDDKELDAVVVSTPDHWHALMTIMACAAGKDVYVEKPMTLFVREGQWMIQAARKYKRVVQVGTQQRSGRHYRKAMDLVRGGHIGKVHAARAASFRNITPGFGTPPDSPTPGDIDYDLWLGPAPARPYNPQRSLYHFRWFWDYSGGQMTNLAAHEIDIVQWYMNVKGPNAVASSGGRLALKDNGETPDTQDGLFEYPGFTMLYSIREASAGRRAGVGLEFFGDKGSLTIGRDGYQVHADLKVDPASLIPVFTGHPAGGPKRTEVVPAPWTQALKEPGSSDEQFDRHVRNFLDCLKSRQRTIADVEDGHQTAVACHLANLSLRTGRKIRWDPESQQVLGDREAAAMLVRPYRKPWDSVLRSLVTV
ncbi:MAG: Gfo/Idh/MocA family protein [Bryobacteraceae bacterium]